MKDDEKLYSEQFKNAYSALSSLIFLFCSEYSLNFIFIYELNIFVENQLWREILETQQPRIGFNSCVKKKIVFVLHLTYLIRKHQLNNTPTLCPFLKKKKCFLVFLHDIVAIKIDKIDRL